MRYVISLVGGFTALVVLAAIGLGGSGVVSAAPVTIQGTATGANEVPAVTGAGAVVVRFTFDDATKVLTYTATVNGISTTEVTAAHIHRGARGVNGPIVYTLSATSFSNVSGSINLTDADVADLKAGNFYFNAHSAQNPGGFARLQLNLPAAAPAPAPTPRVAPPTTGDAGLAAQESSIAVPLAIAGLVMLSGFGALGLARRRI